MELDREALDEIELLTEVIVASDDCADRLTGPALDAVLGLPTHTVDLRQRDDVNAARAGSSA